MACWENAEFYFYYYYYLFISLCSYGDFFCALKHQHQTSRWKIGRWNRWTRNFLCFYSMTFWKISELVEELVLLLNIKTISHKFWNEAQGIYLPQLNRKLLLYLDALVYNVPFFCCVHFFLEAPLFPVVYSPLCFGCFCYCEPVNTFCTEYKKPFSS